MTVAWYPRPDALPAADERMLVVEASAGTGKTFFLEHRVVDRVLAGSSIDEILLVTFTEKATAELRTRIRDLLGKLAAHEGGEPGAHAWRIDDAARARLEAARAGFERAAIHTIHGFCQRILVEDAFAGRRLFDQQQIADEIAFGEAYRLALREALAVKPELKALLAAYLRLPKKSVESLEDLLLRCARAGATIGPRPEPPRTLAAARALRDELARHADGAALVAAIPKVHANTRRALARKFDEIAALLAETPDEPIALLSLAHTLKEQLAYCVEKQADKQLAPVAGFLRAAAELRAASPSLEAACAIAFLPEIEERLATRKARRGLFDYQDMLELVWAVLDGPRGAELAARLRRRHPWAMIDEFQDTDLLQWKIFRRVWLDEPAAAGGLTIVGDPKQAIYSFRGADVHTYLEAREEMRARGATVLALAHNHRSSRPMIEALDQIFRGSLGYPFFTREDIKYEPVAAAGAVAVADARGHEPAPVCVLRLAPGPGGADKPSADAIRDALHGRVADEVHAILRERPLTITTPKEARPVRAKDIFVLTRSNQEAEHVAAALRARGIAAAHRQAEHLFQTDEAKDVADLLDAIAAPRDRSRRLRAWTTCFFAVPLAQLGALGDVPDAHPLVALLHDWRGLALRRDYEALFARILDDTRLAERALVTGRGARTVGNVLHVFEMLIAEVARSRGELHEVVAQLRRWIAQGTLDRPDDSDVQRLDHDGDAVHVMTIHRAKGLEAAVVFVVGGAGAGNHGDRVHLYHDGGTRIAHIGDKDGDAAERIDREAQEENQRLCYVALTRAKVRMYLWLGAGIKPNAPYWPVHDAVARLVEQRAPSFEVEDVPVGAPPRGEAGAADLAALADVLDREWPAAPAPAELGPRAGFEVTSYTQLAHATPDDFRADVEDTGAQIAPPAPTELPPGAETGIFLHEILEHVDFAAARDTTAAAWADRDDVRAVIDAAARRHAITDRAHLEHARDIVWKTLTNEIAIGDVALPPLCRASRIAREVEFTFPLPGGRGFATGFIDLLVAWDERVWIVDYKSNVLGELGLAAAEAEVAKSYEWQTKLYAIAAQRMLGARDDGALASRFGGLVFWFLRPQLLVARRPTWAEIERWHADLIDLPPQRGGLP